MTEQLIQAAEAGDTTTVQRLLKEGADINGRDAQASDFKEIIEILLKAGAR